MNLFVCVKPVPDPEKYHLLNLDPVTKRLIREGIPTILNPADRNALEMALQLREKCGGKVTVIAMAPPFTRETVRECLAMGADRAYMVSDRAFGGADTLSTSYTLMKAIQKTGEKPDLIFAGNESADGATSHVPVQLAEWLGIPSITNAIRVESLPGEKLLVEKKAEGTTLRYSAALPLVISVSRGVNMPRLISAYEIVAMREKRTEALGKEDLDADEAMLGLAGSPTQPGALILPELSRSGEMLEGEPEELARQILSAIRKTGVKMERSL